MDISRETLLMTEDSKTRSVILFDAMKAISDKIDKFNEVEDRVEDCEKKIATIRGVGLAISAIFSGLAAWMGFK